MTIEEAIKEIKDASDSEVRYGDKDNHYDKVMKRVEAFDMAIKVLEERLEIHDTCKKCIEFSNFEQKPCGDCISRAKALEMLGDEPENWTDTEKEIQEINDYRWFKSILEELPSVTPSRPKGKWIHWTDDYKDYVTCSCCGYGEEGEVLLSDKTPFCPICGADMRGDTE